MCPTRSPLLARAEGPAHDKGRPFPKVQERVVSRAGRGRGQQSDQSWQNTGLLELPDREMT